MKSPMALGVTLLVLALPTAISSNAIANKSTPAQPQETQAAIVWERSGGIAGICQRLTLRPSAAYVLEDCRKQTVVKRGNLSKGDLEQLKKLLLKQYVQFQWQSSNRGPDMFSDRYTFSGRGSQKPTLSEQAALNQYLAQLAAQLRQQALTQQAPN